MDSGKWKAIISSVSLRRPSGNGGVIESGESHTAVSVMSHALKSDVPVYSEAERLFQEQVDVRRHCHSQLPRAQAFVVLLLARTCKV